MLVEYAFLLTAIAIPATVGIVLGGVAMLKEYQQAKTEIMQPLP